MRKEIISYSLWLLMVVTIIKGMFTILNLDEPAFFWTITLFVSGASVLAFSVLVVFGNKNPIRFVRLVLSSVVAKLIVFSLFFAGVIYPHRENANDGIVLFLLLYICCTTIAVVLVFKKISADS